MPGQPDRGQVVTIVRHTGREGTAGHDAAADDSEDRSRVRGLSGLRAFRTRAVSPGALPGMLGPR
jgi:hypothetical protein